MTTDNESDGLGPEGPQNDPLRDTYRRSITEPSSVLQALLARQVALLVVDVQYLDAAPGHGVFADPSKSQGMEYYFESLKRTVLPNIARLQTAFREQGLEVIHTRIQSLTLDGRDRSPGHKRLGLHAPPGSKDAEFLPEVAPLPNEIIINKTASGVFSASNLEYVLRNLGIQALFVTGVYTNECVSTTIRTGSDLGFHVSLVQDACTTVTPELQASAIRTLRDRYCRVMRTGTAVREIRRIVAAH